MESDFLCLGNQMGPQDFCFHRRGLELAFQPFLHAPVGHFSLNSEGDYCHFPQQSCDRGLTTGDSP